MTTRKRSWKELIAAIHRTFRLWGVRKYILSPPEAPARRDRWHSPEQRKVVVQFTRLGTAVVLCETRRATAHENLEMLALTLETLRASDAHGVEPSLIAAYRQLAPSTAEPPPARQPSVGATGPYAVLGVEPNYPLHIIEIIWKARLRVEHPDLGGSAAKTQALNVAMAEIRKLKGVK